MSARLRRPAIAAASARDDRLPYMIMSESSDKWRMSEVYLRRMLSLKGEVLSRFETGHLTTLYFLAEGLALLGRLQPEDVTPTSRRKRLCEPTCCRWRSPLADSRRPPSTRSTVTPTTSSSCRTSYSPTQVLLAPRSHQHPRAHRRNGPNRPSCLPQ